jgi:hypothetical protein
MTRTLVANNIFNPPQLISNSGMDFWQRTNVSVSAGGTPQYQSIDRFQLETGGAGTANVTRTTDSPGSQWGPFSIVFTQVGSGATSHRLWQRIESSVIAPYVGQVLTISFWAKVSAVNANTAFQTIVAVPASQDTWPSENTSASQILGTSEISTAFTAGVWKRLSYSFTVPATAALGLCIGILGISDTAGHAWTFNAPMLTPIGVPDRLIRTAGTIQQELAHCQRYYEKAWNIDTPVGSSGTSGLCAAVAVSTTEMSTSVRFAAHKRTSPTMVCYSRTGNQDALGTPNSNADVAGVSSINFTAGTGGFCPIVIGAGTLTTGTTYRYFWTANSEL